DAILSTLVQRRFGQSLGFGEIKPDDDSTTNHSLCIDTLKLAVLSRNSVLNRGHPILTFQANGCQLVFYMTQMIHRHFFTTTEIGRVTMPEAFHSFMTLTNLSTLLRVTHMFWHCCYQADASPSETTSASTSSPVKATPTNALSQTGSDTSTSSHSASPHIVIL
ncbi:hypothetical protein DM01DRAFT_259939, partial [Hesseltinella vesiculosa]